VIAAPAGVRALRRKGRFFKEKAPQKPFEKPPCRSKCVHSETNGVTLCSLKRNKGAFQKKVFAELFP